IKRTSSDGAELIYTYDASKSTTTDKVYVNKEGSGSYDTLTFSTANNNAAMQEFGINTPQRQAMFLAQLSVESGELRSTSENLNYRQNRLLEVFPKYFNNHNVSAYSQKPQAIANRVYANRMGNGDELSGDGWSYRGRGLIQITGRNGYARTSRALGVDLINNPDLLNNPDLATRSAAEYFQRRGLNELSDSGNIREVTRLINGVANGPSTHLELRQNAYERALDILNIH
ncbi:MAG TPA: glycoside hydrolase family 19 protein, partial [Methylotenera sp.]|nr:glycoside hydrolase family 19 protein [Methylotenera sp.]